MPLSSPSPVLRRLAALLFGPWYLFGLVQILIVAKGVAAPIAASIVLLGAGAIMAVMCVFGVKAFRRSDRRWRFNLSTALLVIVPLSIYLAAIRFVMSGDDAPRLDWAGWRFVAIFSFLFMAFTTVLLLGLAEALMWLAVIVFRAVRRGPFTP